MRIPRRDYAAMYGPTVGDGIRLADTSLHRLYASILTSLIGVGAREVAACRNRKQADVIIDAVIEYLPSPGEVPLVGARRARQDGRAIPAPLQRLRGAEHVHRRTADVEAADDPGEADLVFGRGHGYARLYHGRARAQCGVSPWSGTDGRRGARRIGGHPHQHAGDSP